MADEVKEEMADPFERQEAQTEEQAGSKEPEKSTEEAAAEEAMMAMTDEESAAAEAAMMALTEEEEAAHAEAGPQKSSEEIAAEEAMLAMVSEGESKEEEELGSSPEPTNKNLDLLMGVNLQITVELGRKDMNFGDILQLGRGSIVELNKMADEPVDIYVNQSKIAFGEVVVVDEHFGVRITKLLSPSRMKKLG